MHEITRAKMEEMCNHKPDVKQVYIQPPLFPEFENE
jgi:hypothetical protein